MLPLQILHRQLCSLMQTYNTFTNMCTPVLCKVATLSLKQALTPENYIFLAIISNFN